MRSGTVLQVAVFAAAALLHLEVTANNSVVGEEALFGGSPDEEHHRRALGFHKMVYYPNSNIQGVIGGITAAFFVKITSGVDDIVWLAPCVVSRAARQTASLLTDTTRPILPAQWHAPVARPAHPHTAGCGWRAHTGSAGSCRCVSRARGGARDGRRRRRGRRVCRDAVAVAVFCSLS